MLDLSSNSLHGSIPHCLGDLNSTLSVINLHKNQFKGTIPSTLCMGSILVLVLSSNMLGGALPHCFFTDVSINLNILDLHDNQLQGKIPQTFPSTCNLTTFNINNNYMEGPIPLNLANCKQLQILDIGNNKISDTFPSWLVALPELQILVLRLNRFHGNLSVKKMKYPFPKLRIMDLSHNQFSGSLPINFFDNFKLMANSDQNVGLNSSKISGSYYEASVSLTVKGNEVEVKKILYIYTSIDLSSNKFNGEVPGAIGEYKSLRLLNLSHNSLTGNIPSSLGNMSLLESLDLSSNQLTSKIPWQLNTLEFLSTLNLSTNNLSGAIPQGRHFDTFGNGSFLDNLALCGAPLTKKCRDDEVPSREVEDDVWFDWKVVLIGYGCGLIGGLSAGYIVFTTLKPWRFVMIIERAQQKLITRYIKNT